MDLAAHLDIHQRKKLPTAELAHETVPSTHGTIPGQGLCQHFSYFNAHLETLFKFRL